MKRAHEIESILEVIGVGYPATTARSAEGSNGDAPDLSRRCLQFMTTEVDGIAGKSTTGGVGDRRAILPASRRLMIRGMV